MKYYICAILKDEHLFLQEWIEYHLSLGFDRIYLYEDFTSKSHSEITGKYENVELHSMREIPSCIEGCVGRQVAVYNDFIENHDNGWCLFIDIDEFLRLDDGVTLESLTNDFKDNCGIAIQWEIYGANGYVKRPNGLSVQEAYSADLKEHFLPFWHYKSFVNLSKKHLVNQYFLNCHYFKKIVNTDHKKCDYRPQYNELSYNLCHIDHYITKSWEDYIVRGSIIKGFRNVDTFFEVNANMLPLKEKLLKEWNLTEFFAM